MSKGSGGRRIGTRFHGTFQIVFLSRSLALSQQAGSHYIGSALLAKHFKLNCSEIDLTSFFSVSLLLFLSWLCSVAVFIKTVVEDHIS